MIVLDLETVPAISKDMALQIAGDAGKLVDAIHGGDEDAEHFASLSPPLAQIAVAGIWNQSSNRAFTNMRAFGGERGEPDGVILPCVGETTLLDCLFNYICARERWPLVTFNGKKFDLPVILAACLRNGVKVPKEFMALWDQKPWERDLHVDLYHTFGGKGSLRAWCVGMGLGDPKAEGDGAQIGDLCRAGKVSKAAKYCLSDCEYAGRLYLRWVECTR